MPDKKEASTEYILKTIRDRDITSMSPWFTNVPFFPKKSFYYPSEPEVVPADGFNFNV
ncbi:hypothetical protein ACFLUJ_06035 [Chloroflexota bacterium]